jgi:hypothetical protein
LSRSEFAARSPKVREATKSVSPSDNLMLCCICLTNPGGGRPYLSTHPWGRW